MGTRTVLVTGSCIRSAIWKLLADTSVGIQVLAISVSYQGQLLTILVSNPNALRGAILFNPRYSPLLGQITASRTVLSQMLPRRSDLALFIPEGPWRTEARTRPAESLLSQSVDLNAVHLWRIRACYLTLSRIGGAIACLMGLTSLA